MKAIRNTMVIANIDIYGYICLKCMNTTGKKGVTVIEMRETIGRLL